MKVSVDFEIDVAIEGRDVVLSVYDSDGEVTEEVEFSIYELVRDYMLQHEIPNTGKYKFSDEDKRDIEILVAELEDAIGLAEECMERETA